jgi:dienelactone hydrolase
VTGQRARALAVVVLVLACVPAAAAASHPFPRFAQPFCARADFTSAGTRVRAELCRATRDAAAGRAVVVLHGCGGFNTFDHRLADTLPLDGVSTLYVDYFAPTPPPGNRGWCSSALRVTQSPSRAERFSTWARVVNDAVAALDRTPAIVPARVGLVGWSLGGGLAVRVAETDSAVHAVAAFSTGLFGGGPASVPHMPPLLLLSGGTTDAIPLSWTLALYHAARSAGTKVSLFVYPHGSHSWLGQQGTIGIARAARFLRAAL